MPQAIDKDTSDEIELQTGRKPWAKGQIRLDTTTGIYYSFDGTDWVAMSGGGGATPTGTGFRHVTAGVEDAASKLVDTADVNNDQVTYAKMQNIATDRLVGRDTAATGDPEEITLNATLEFTGAGAIQRAALTGEATAPAGSNATTVAATHSGSAHHAQSHGAADHTGDILPDGSEQVLGTGDITITQKVAPTNPAAGDRKVYVDSGTGKLSVRTSGGSSVSLEEQGGGVTFAAPTAAIDIGDAAGEGVATTALRSDAQFAFPAPAAAYPVDIDSTAEADGTATTPARADHKHALAANGVSNAKLAQMAANTVKANVGILGDPEDLAVGASTVVGRGAAGDLVAATLETSQIADNAVTLTKLLDIATASILGRTTAATGDPEVLTSAQATAILDLFTSALKGLVPSSGGGTTNFLRADATFAAPPGTAHALDGALHTLAGSAAGRFLRALTATTFALEAVPFARGGTLLNSAGLAAVNVMVWRAPFPCTVTNLRGYRVGGTGATINAGKGTVGTPTVKVLAADLSLTNNDTAWQDGGAVQNTAFAAGDPLIIILQTVTGTVTQVAIQVDFTRP